MTDVQFSPDGYILASAAADGQVKLWDLRAGKPMHTFQVSRSADPGQNRTVVWISRSRFLAARGWATALSAYAYRYACLGGRLNQYFLNRVLIRERNHQI